jgi:prepilin-type N-terminal cleavage/methylation domain-containing protein
MDRRGFTIIEIMIAVIILSVGLLGLASTAALVTRMIGRGQHSAVSVMFAQRTMDSVRVAAKPTACAASIPSTVAGGSNTLYRGSALLATNVWTFSKTGTDGWVLRDSVRYVTAKNNYRSDVLATAFSCRL